MAEANFVVGHSKFVPYPFGEGITHRNEAIETNDFFKIMSTNVDGDATVKKFSIKAIFFDFDGCWTTGDVWTDQNGIESVRCSRRDSLGLARLRDQFPDLILGVITSEQNPVVQARCTKLKLPVYVGDHTAKSKLDILQRQLTYVGFPAIYVGDDINDLECMACMDVISVCPGDAHPKIKQEADFVLKHKGGKGAVRELCDLFMTGYFDKYAYKFNN